MSLAEFRDLIIVIFGIGGLLALIIMVLLAFLLYYRLKPILDSVKETTKTVQRITSSVEEAVVKPIAQITSFIQGIRNALGLVKRFTNREED